MEKLTLRPMECAELLGIGKSKVYNMLKRGQLPSVRLGHSVRVPVDALRAWIARQTAEHEQP